MRHYRPSNPFERSKTGPRWYSPVRAKLSEYKCVAVYHEDPTETGNRRIPLDRIIRNVFNMKSQLHAEITSACDLCVIHKTVADLCDADWEVLVVFWLISHGIGVQSMFCVNDIDHS